MIQYELYYATLPPMERKITLKVWRVMRPPMNFRMTRTIRTFSRLRHLLNVLVGAMVVFVSWSWRDALELTMLKNLTLGVKSEFWGLDMWKLYSMS
jgi:hypothetical protein